jgi:hypothetical protein
MQAIHGFEKSFLAKMLESCGMNAYTGLTQNQEQRRPYALC